MYGLLIFAKLKDIFLFLSLVIDSVEVREEPWELCCCINFTAVFATKRACCNTGSLD